MQNKTIDFGHIKRYGVFVNILQAIGVDFEKSTEHRHSLICMCPFHQPSNKSVSIDNINNTYNCSVCESSGDIIDFVAKFESKPISEAAEYVAGLSGLGLRRADVHVSEDC